MVKIGIIPVFILVAASSFAQSRNIKPAAAVFNVTSAPFNGQCNGTYDDTSALNTAAAGAYTVAVSANVAAIPKGSRDRREKGVGMRAEITSESGRYHRSSLPQTPRAGCGRPP